MEKKCNTFSSAAEMQRYNEGKAKERFVQIQTACSKYGLENKMEGQEIYIETDQGKWKFDGTKDKVHLFHKNYKFRQSTVGNYHRQWVRDVTMEELVKYIVGHDHVKRFRW